MRAVEMRPKFQWAAVQSCFDQPIFDQARTADLLLVVGRPVHANGLPPEKLQVRLLEITSTFALSRWLEVQPSLSKQDAQLAKLIAALAIALETAGLQDELSTEKLLPMFGRGGLFAAAALRGESDGEAGTIQRFAAVWQLHQDALKMREIQNNRRGMRGGQKGRPEERAVKLLAAKLSELFWLTWLESPGVGLTDTGRPQSPFMRLFVYVQQALQQRGVDHARTPEALAKTWHSLDDFEKLKFQSSWEPGRG